MKRLLTALQGKPCDRPPFWFMRQAGRYLPEYRQTRAQAGSFLDLCFNPELATEVTLQPLRRFQPDAAILFSDILVVPMALGQKLSFTGGEGPKLDPVRNGDDFKKLSREKFHETLSPVYETVSRIRENLDEETALIGFAGAPWTIAAYMVEGSGSRDFVHPRRWAYEDPAGFSRLIGLIVETTAEYLSKQVEAGAEALQIFDSWAGLLPPHEFHNWVIEPTQKLVRKIRKNHPDIPIIGFPKGAGQLYRDYADRSGVTALGLDAAVPPDWAAQRFQSEGVPVQGNLDPVLLLSGGRPMEDAARYILDALSGGPFVFNLGHGVIKETPPEHVAQLSDLIRNHV